LAGASSGAALLVGMRYALALPHTARVVCVFADGGERYLHTVYDDDWMRAHDMPTDADVNTLRARALALPVFLDHPAAAGPPSVGLATTLGTPASTLRVNDTLRNATSHCNDPDCTACTARGA